MKIYRNNNLSIPLLLFSALVIVSLACGTITSATPTIPNLNLVATYVKQTVDALPPIQTVSTPTLTPAPTTTFTPAPTTAPTVTEDWPLCPPTGSISGMLSYPASGIPRLRVVAFRLEDSSIRYIETASNPYILYYEFDLPVGTYSVVAYSLGGEGLQYGEAGGYTEAVLCGLAVDCTDHTLIAVTVTAGSTTVGVNPGDWYASPDAFPPIPNP